MDNFQESRQKLFGDKTESTAKEVLKTMSKEIGIAKELLKVMSNDINIVLSEDTLLLIGKAMRIMVNMILILIPLLYL